MVAGVSVTAQAADTSTDGARLEQQQQQIRHQQERINALQSQVNAIQARQNSGQTPAMSQSGGGSWADNTKLGLLMFLDTTNLSQNLNGNKTGVSGFGFDAKRIQINLSHRFDQTWSVHLATDFHAGTKGDSGVVMKRAYLQGAFDPLFVLQAGSANLPWTAYEEGLYGFRYVEHTVEERVGVTPSIADWGLHALGKKGIFDYQLSVVNGAGFKSVNNRSRQPDVALRLGVHPLQGLTVAAGAYEGKHAQAGPSGVSTRDGVLYHALVGYVHNGLRVGGEYFNQLNPNQYKNVAFGGTNYAVFPSVQGSAVLRSNRSDRAQGYSLWASCEVLRMQEHPVTVFARFDRVRPSKEVDSSLRDTYFNVGAQYAVRKGILVALVYKHDKSKDDTQTLLNNEVGVFSQISF